MPSFDPFTTHAPKKLVPGKGGLRGGINHFALTPIPVPIFGICHIFFPSKTGGLASRFVPNALEAIRLVYVCCALAQKLLGPFDLRDFF